MASPEDALDTLDAPGNRRVVVWQGRTFPLPDPASMTWREVVETLEDPARLVGHLPALRGVGAWRWVAVHEAWVQSFALGEPRSARRLCYVMSRHGTAIEADFARWYPGTSAAALWRDREWGRLMTLVDHLPANTHYHAALSQDEEHARMLVEAETQSKKDGTWREPSKHPSMTSWSPEVAAITAVTDAVNHLAYVFGKANGGSGNPPKPLPRPTSVMEKVRLRTRAAAHAILVRRMLPHQFEDDDQT